MYGSFVYGWQVKLCDPILTLGSYLSALETGHNKVLYKFNFLTFTFTTTEPGFRKGSWDSWEFGVVGWLQIQSYDMAMEVTCGC